MFVYTKSSSVEPKSTLVYKPVFQTRSMRQLACVSNNPIIQLSLSADHPPGKLDQSKQLESV